MVNNLKKELSFDTKERILKAALEVFTEKGKFGARMQEIADRADINKAMLHYYFTDKDTLYEKSLEYMFSKLFSRLISTFDVDTPFPEKVKQLINTHIDFLFENTGFPRIITRELADGGEVFKKVIRDLIKSGPIAIPETFINHINKAKENGEIRDVDTEQVIISILGMNVFYFIAKPVIDVIWNIQPENQKKFIENRKQSIVDFIVHGLKK